jgi:hypothetical protein
MKVGRAGIICGLALRRFDRSYFVTFPKADGYPYIALLNATGIMRQAADRLGQHGFCFACEKPGKPHGIGITVCTLDPAHLFRSDVKGADSRRESELTKFFEEVLSKEGIAYRTSLEALVESLRSALGTSVSMTLLREGHWSDDVDWLEQMGAELSEFRYWGMLADFSVQVGTNSAAKQRYRLLDPPCVEAAVSGIQIIIAVTGTQSFQHGRITAKPLFLLARLLRRAVDLARSAEPDSTAWQWIQLRLVPFIVELTYLAQSWIDRTAPKEQLHLLLDPGPATADNFRGFRDRLASILADHPLLRAFEAGWRAGARGASDRAACDALANVMARVKRDNPTWPDCQALLPPEMAGVGNPAQLLQLTTATPASAALLECLLKVADRWVPHLERRQRFLEDVACDLEDLRRGISDRLQTLSPDKLPCIFIGADGMVGTMLIERPPQMPMVDHSVEVAVLNRSSGRDLLAIYDWATLSDGRLQVLSDNVVGSPLLLEEWRPVHPASATVIDNAWKGHKINLNYHGLLPSGPIGARFFRIALSKNAPSEIAIVINTAAEHVEGAGWAGQINS